MSQWHQEHDWTAARFRLRMSRATVSTVVFYPRGNKALNWGDTLSGGDGPGAMLLYSLGYIRLA